MNHALFLISLQHELAMSIGNDLRLCEMLRGFLKVCLNRVHLSSCHVFLYQDNEQNPMKFNLLNSHKLQHYTSIPYRHDGKKWQQHPTLKTFEAFLLENLNKNHIEKKIQHDFFYAFNLPNQGFLVWHSKHPLSADVKHSITPMLNKLARSCYSCIVHDELLSAVSAKQVAEKKVDHQATHDGLTSLYNREHINILIEKAYINAKFQGSTSVVIFIDLNKFKTINDTMGHSVGDQILIEVATRLNSLSSANISAARFGGDQFVLVANQLSNDKEAAREEVTQIIKKINNLFLYSIHVEDTTYNMGVTLGYCLFPDTLKKADDAIKFADIAMYEAKREKLVNGLEFQSHMAERLAKKEAYIREMKHGLQNNEFMLYYQPQHNDKNEIIGAEALLRWNNPKRGMESPQVYIPIAEESNLILDIGDWVIEQACRDLQKIQKITLPDSFKKIAINVSPKQLIQPHFNKHLLNNISETAITANLLSIEITEGLLIENFQETISKMLALKKEGIDCSIDDFGTGYSSLTYLKRIPATLIKIDRSFVTNIHEESEGIAIANMIIALGESLQMDVLAEGVETIEELSCLKKLGCFKYQGYYFNKPMPFESFLQLLH